jgi:hypothetical protein
MAEHPANKHLVLAVPGCRARLCALTKAGAEVGDELRRAAEAALFSLCEVGL